MSGLTCLMQIICTANALKSNANVSRAVRWQVCHCMFYLKLMCLELEQNYSICFGKLVLTIGIPKVCKTFCRTAIFNVPLQ